MAGAVDGAGNAVVLNRKTKRSVKFADMYSKAPPPGAADAPTSASIDTPIHEGMYSGSAEAIIDSPAHEGVNSSCAEVR